MIANSEVMNRETADAATREGATPTTRMEARPRPQVPPVDIYETEQSIVMLADVPGVAEDGVDLTIDRGVLTLRARSRQTPPEGFEPIYQEYVPTDFERQFTLGDAIDSERISATVTNGVLRLELPKASRAVPRKIAVKAG
jgi:HSP20 family molecular chaperone IbpA